MKAGEVVFQSLLNGKIQYVVPLFQRPYSWGEEQWGKLWDDLIEVYEMAEPANHFIGSVVTQQITTSPEGASRYTLIDGQQRMTSLFILLSVIRNVAQERENDSDPELVEEILVSSLINKFVKGDGQNKLLPTQRDREDFFSVMNGQVPESDSAIGKAATYFAKALDNGDSEGNELRLRTLYRCIVERLDMVSIHLDSNDSPNRIFESLNNTGLPLSVADLIRNFFLMNIPDAVQQEDAYNKYWLPMESLLSGGSRDKSPDFFWRYLMMDGSFPRIDDTYAEIQKRFNYHPNQQESVDALKDFKRFARHYAQIADLSHLNADENVMVGMRRLNQWEVDVAYPLLMRLFDALESGLITNDDLCAVMGMIESFVVRRIVCGVHTNQLRRIFAQMSGQAKDRYDHITDFAHDHLSNNRWPRDDEFRAKFVDFRLYIRGRLNRTRLVLDSLERSFAHKETPELTSNITIEHIMPQSLSDWWKDSLGSNYSEIHEQWLNTVGNLTLSGYNPDMGNSPFPEKKKILAESNFALSDSIQTIENWNAAAIKERGELLANQALQIWKR